MCILESKTVAFDLFCYFDLFLFAILDTTYQTESSDLPNRSNESVEHLIGRMSGADLLKSFQLTSKSTANLCNLH